MCRFVSIFVLVGLNLVCAGGFSNIGYNVKKVVSWRGSCSLCAINELLICYTYSHEICYVFLKPG